VRKAMLILLVGVVWVNVGCAVALADGMILPPPEALASGYLVVRHHTVDVAIDDNHAVTRVEQVFYNPYPFPVEGRYLFPIPPEAMLSRFQASVEGQPQQVIRQDPDETKSDLYDVLAQQRDPSLLQYAGWESLAFDLSLEPGSSRQMSLEYEEVLAPEGGLYRYRYVLSTERYSSQALEQVSLSVDVNSSSGLASLYSSTHPVTVDRQGPGHAVVSWAAEDVRPTEDFELYFAPSDAGFGAGLLTGRRGDQDHFLLIFSPEVKSHPSDALPKDILFVVDRSGSMGGEKIEQARNALSFILDQLGEEDRFSIIGFDERLSVLDSELLRVDSRTIGSAQRFVGKLDARGNTDIDAALQAGLDILARGEDRDATRMMVFLTDGLPTAGITDDVAIARLVAEANDEMAARLHVFGVGYDVNTHLLDRLASDNGGSVTYIAPGEDLEGALTEFYGRIAHPLLTDLEVSFEGMDASDVYPQALPDLFWGSSLLITGRYRARGDTVSIHVRGREQDAMREYIYEVDLGQSGNRDFVPRLWATRRIGALLDEVRVDGESPSLIDEIRELGVGYGLVTPYNTLVIEGQADGVASASTMSLYDRPELNQAWGETTIQARIQNQAYQQAYQADLAVGANVTNKGQHSFAQVGAQSLDLSLLEGQRLPDGPIGVDWVERNIGIHQTVDFASEEYFALAEDPAARALLQSGPNVIFGYNGQVISVQDGQPQTGPPIDADVQVQGSAERGMRSDQRVSSTSAFLGALHTLIGLLADYAF
jgi:Ca-activated chloride channel family protein